MYVVNLIVFERADKGVEALKHKLIKITCLQSGMMLYQSTAEELRTCKSKIKIHNMNRLTLMEKNRLTLMEKFSVQLPQVELIKRPIFAHENDINPFIERRRVLHS